MNAIAVSPHTNKLFANEDNLDLAALVRSTIAEAKVTILNPRGSKQNGANQNNRPLKEQSNQNDV